MCFQRHSCFSPTFPQRSFVFNNIPVLFVQFLKLLHLRTASLPRRNVDSEDLADVRHQGVIALGGGSNPRVAGWEFFPQARQYPRFAGGS
jgi:hypothetical protein